MGQANSQTGRRRRRRGFGGWLCESKTGRAVGATTFLTPLVGYIIHDLQKPDSLIRQLSKAAVTGFVALRRQPREQIDISDKAEVQHIE
jgi:hypothetical protein